MIYSILFIPIVIMVGFGFLLNSLLFRTWKEIGEKRNHEQYEDIHEKVTFLSGKNELTGYIYGVDNTKGLIIISHGMGVVSDYYLPEVLRFVEEGYMVLSFDNTNYRKNGGHYRGFTQGVKDLYAAIEFGKRAGLPISLMGHSMGGYCVGAVLNLTDADIRNVVCIAGFDNVKESISFFMKENVKGFSAAATLLLCLVQRFYFGKKWKLSAVDGINHTDCNVLIAQGLHDEEVIPDQFAIYAKRDLITNKNLHIKTFDEGNKATHMGIVRSVSETKPVNEELMEEILLMMEKNRM